MFGANFLELIVGFVIALALLLAEYFLCTKMRSPLWGGIIPCLILAGTIWIFASGAIPLEMQRVFPFFILNTLFFSDWGTGRDIVVPQHIEYSIYRLYVGILQNPVIILPVPVDQHIYKSIANSLYPRPERRSKGFHSMAIG